MERSRQGQRRDAPAQSQTTDFANKLFELEEKIIAGCKNPEYQPDKDFGALLKFVMESEAFRDLRKGALADHSLWRVIAIDSVRELAINCACFINPSYVAEQAELVAVIGRFATPGSAAHTFLEEVRDGVAPGLIMLNQVAVRKAGEILDRGDLPPSIPTRESDLAMMR